MARSSHPALTARAIILGLLVGVIPTASGLYLGLKTGWGFGSTFFSVLLGYPFLRFVDGLSRSGRGTTLQEHCILVSVSSAVSNLTMSGWVNGIPALYKLGLLDHNNFANDMFRLCVWSICLASFAVMVALFMAPHFLARSDLPFPSSTGAAHLMLQMHDQAVPLTSTISAQGVAESSAAGIPPEIADEPVKDKRNALGVTPAASQPNANVQAQQRVLLMCLGGSFLYLFASHALPVLKEFHVFWVLAGSPSRYGPHPESGLTGFFFQLERFSLFFTVSFAFFGAGMMMGMRSASSFFYGSFVSWFLLGHFVVEKLEWVPDPWDPTRRFFHSPAKMNPLDPGVAYWLLWPGITLLVVNAMTDLAFNLLTQIWSPAAPAAAAAGGKAGVRPGDAEAGQAAAGPSPASPFKRPVRVLIVGGFTAFMATAVVTRATFRMELSTAYLALALGVVLTYVGTQAAGSTDMNPTGTLAKVTKCVFSLVPAPSQARHQVYSMTGAMISTGTSSQAVDLICDYKLGSICKTPIMPQFHAQLIGALAAAPLTTALFALYVRAYPCIIAAQDEVCMLQHGFTLTAANTWKVFAVAMTDASALSQIPSSSVTLCWILTGVVVASNAARRWILPKAVHAWLPHWNAVGVSMLTSRMDFALATFVGAVASSYWARRSPRSYEILMFTVASGLIAGEGLWGLFAALCNIAGIPEGWLSRAGLPR
ncbi:hypothetical protein H9P43_001740 [Blastocladiella emersonii ATCC 22665]|nr:hypothetical protein H9P43_001740 [Blastocladiella emersonii ATCC 22665]